MLDAGVRDVRNQGVLMRGVNDAPRGAARPVLRACRTSAQITPYYFYMCDMIPFSEHWRISLADAQHLQHAIMGYLPGFATPRIVCDVPFVGKRWVHQVDDYDRDARDLLWRKNYRTSIEGADPEALSRDYVYYDPIYTLPEPVRRGGAHRVMPRRRTLRPSRPPPPVARPRLVRPLSSDGRSRARYAVGLGWPS